MKKILIVLALGSTQLAKASTSVPELSGQFACNQAGRVWNLEVTQAKNESGEDIIEFKGNNFDNKFLVNGTFTLSSAGDSSPSPFLPRPPGMTSTKVGTSNVYAAGSLMHFELYQNKANDLSFNISIWEKIEKLGDGSLKVSNEVTNPFGSPTNDPYFCKPKSN